MGIINLTPDSFYDGGKHKTINDAIITMKSMIQHGANIIDLGACSSRPGSKLISLKEEEKRLFPVLIKARTVFPDITISIDTYRYQIAEQAISYGADLINDVYVEKDQNKMFETVSKHNTPYVLMHMLGTPKTMQKKIYYVNFKKDILMFFRNKITLLNNLNFNKIIIDPGFGFGKTLSQNYQLLNMIPEMKKFKYPILAGVSRKSMINTPLNIENRQALNGTTVVNTIALLKGAKILRVHDVKETKETIEIFKLAQQNKQ